MSSQQTTAAQPDQSTRPVQSTESLSDDTILVWREVKCYQSMQQPLTDGLYADFRETFDGWTKERFQKVDPQALRALKWTLRSGGVYTGNIRKHTAESLADLAQLPCVENGTWPCPPAWDQKEFAITRFNPRSEAQVRQSIMAEVRRRQQGLPPQPAPRQILPPQQPAGVPPQTPFGQGPPPQQPGQLPVQQTSSTPLIRAPPDRVTAQGPAQQALSRAHIQPGSYPRPPPLGPTPQRLFPMGSLGRRAQQTQQQPGPQLQPSQPQSDSDAP